MKRNAGRIQADMRRHLHEGIKIALDDPSFVEILILCILKGVTRQELDLLKIQRPEEHWFYETASPVEKTAKEVDRCRDFSRRTRVQCQRPGTGEEEPNNGMAKADENPRGIEHQIRAYVRHI